MRAPGEESLFEKILELFNGVRLQASGLGVVKELCDGLDDGWYFGLNDADDAGGIPARDQIGRCFPRSEVERLPDLLSAQRSLDVDRALAAVVAPGSMRTRFQVSPEERQHPSSLTEPCVSHAQNISDSLSR